MMNWSAAHSGFVLAAYLLSFAVLLAMAAFILLRDRKLAQELRTLERHKESDG
jgi:heme exporter protein CcmD